MDGLDIEKAARQLTVFPIRHLKAGIRLATILFETDRMIMEKLLVRNGFLIVDRIPAAPSSCRLINTVFQKIDIQGRLLDQLEDNITSAPVALQILKALDASIVFGVGLDAFLVGSQSSDMNHSLTPYQRLTRYILKKRVSTCLVYRLRVECLQLFFVSFSVKSSHGRCALPNAEDCIPSVSKKRLFGSEEVSRVFGHLFIINVAMF